MFIGGGVFKGAFDYFLLFCLGEFYYPVSQFTDSFFSFTGLLFDLDI